MPPHIPVRMSLPEAVLVGGGSAWRGHFGGMPYEGKNRRATDWTASQPCCDGRTISTTLRLVAAPRALARRDCIRGQGTSKTIPGATSRSTHPVRPLPGPAGGHLFGPCVAAAGLAMGTGLRSLPDRTAHVAEAKSHLRNQCAPAPGLCCNALVVAHELRGCARTATLKSSTGIPHCCFFLRFQDIRHPVCATEMPVHARKGNCIHLLGIAAQDLSSAFAATARPAFRDRAARLFAKSPCALQRRLHRRQSLSSPRWSLSSLSSSATRARRSLHASGTFLRRPYRVNDLQDDMCIRTELPPALQTDGTLPSAILSLSLYRMMWRSLLLWSAT